MFDGSYSMSHTAFIFENRQSDRNEEFRDNTNPEIKWVFGVNLNFHA